MPKAKKTLDKATEYHIEYAKKKLKRVPLDLPIEDYEQVKSKADSLGETVNGFIKQAIKNRLSE